MKICHLLVMGVLLLQSTLAWGSADYKNKEEGWHRGFYIAGGGGFMNVDEDTNVVTNEPFGNDFLMASGIILGWNFRDTHSVEFQGRYATETSLAGDREHAASASVNFKYSFIAERLTPREKWRLLPYIKFGMGVVGAAVPNTLSTNDRLGVYGPSFVLGAGLDLLITQFLYIALDYTHDFAFLQDKFDATGTKILKGGFDPSPSVFGYVGLHF